MKKANRKMKSIDKLYLGSIIFKRDERTDSAIRELSRFLLRWYRRIGLPSRDRKKLKKILDNLFVLW